MFQLSDTLLMGATTTKEHISICICTYKRPVPLRRLLQSLASQDISKDICISFVIVDNDSAETARHAVASLGELGVPIQFAVEPEKGFPSARNRAVTLSK